jgi:DNA repair protein RecN (Recombination protein N)
MLVELAVERIALIEAARVRLNPGFTVFTGETGAGKSILLDAIGLILGKRASSDLIRTGADDAVVEALFVLSDRTRASLQPVFDEWGIPVEDGELVITRELQRSGRTVCRVNGRTVTVQM